MPDQNARPNAASLEAMALSNHPDFPAERERCLQRLIERMGWGDQTAANPNEPVPEAPAPADLNPAPEPAAIPEAAGLELTEEPPKERFRLMTAAQLNSDEHKTRYLIPGILAAGQPGGIFGPFKTLKTSLAADLLISLASGTPFLGRFPVAQPGRVLFFTGESGLGVVRSLARRICAERGLSLESLENFVVSPDLPQLDRPIDLMILEELIRKQNAVCVVIDPAYLAMGSVNCRNLFAMGAMLRPLAELCESTGCTILLVHHCKRSSKAGSPATLDDVAWSGFAEFSAQWLLAARRRPFDPETGQHELWLSAGGRAGHHGLWALDVDEGAALPLPDDGPIPSMSEDGRTWKATLRSVSWAQAQADEQFVESSEDRRLRRRAAAVEHQSQRVLELLAVYPDGRTARSMREVLGLSGDRISRVLDRLVEKGVVVTTEERYDRRRMIVTYIRVPMMDLSMAAVKGGRITPPDQKVYDPETGFFSAVGVAHAGMLRPATGGIWNEPATGRDTLFNGENTADLVPTHARREAASSVPPNPVPAAPGAGAVPLAGRDTLSDGENSGILPPTNARREAASSVPPNPVPAALGAGAVPLPHHGSAL